MGFNVIRTKIAQVVPKSNFKLDLPGRERSVVLDDLDQPVFTEEFILSNIFVRSPRLCDPIGEQDKNIAGIQGCGLLCVFLIRKKTENQSSLCQAFDLLIDPTEDRRIMAGIC